MLLVEQMEAQGRGVQAISRAMVQLAAKRFYGRGKLQRIGFAVGYHSLRNFVPMNGDFMRRFDAQPHLVACHAQNLHANAEGGEDDFIIAAARENEHNQDSLYLVVGAFGLSAKRRIHD